MEMYVPLCILGIVLVSLTSDVDVLLLKPQMDGTLG